MPEKHILNASHNKVLVNRKHAPLLYLIKQNLITPQQLHRYRIIAFTRNPFDWLVSLYEYRQAEFQRHKYHMYIAKLIVSKKVINLVLSTKLKEKLGLPHWLIDKNRIATLRAAQKLSFEDSVVQTCRNYNQSVHEPLTLGANVEVLRYEDLQNQMARILEEQGIINPQPILFMNVSKNRNRDFRSYYTPFTRNLVEKAFAKDLERFHYKFDAQVPA